MKKSVVLPTLAVVAVVAASTPGCGSQPLPKVIVLGLDGLTWSFLDPLLKTGQLPHFESLLEDAAFGELETFRPTRSAILWTSVATGKTMEKHGITNWTYVDEEAREEVERLRAVSGIDRTAATIWEILGQKGFSVAVVNWWVTYPARPVNGALITDRLKSLMNKMSIADEPDLVYPPSLIEELRPMFLRPVQVSDVLDEFGFPRYSERAAETMFRSNRPGRTLFRSLRSYVGQDRMVADWALHLFRKQQPDLFAVVLRITDVYAHLAWRFDRAEHERLAPSVRLESLIHEDEAVRETALQRVGELDAVVAKAVLPAYKFADEFVGAIMTSMDPNSILMIVSDHGFSWNGSNYNHNPSRRAPYPETSPPGVIIMKGPDVRPGRLEGAGLFDITPTVLYALGEPIAEDMDGRPLKEALGGSGLFVGREEEFVSTYGGPPAQEAFPFGPAEQELLDDLRSLGYIRGGSSEPPRRREPGAEPTHSNESSSDSPSDRR